MNKPHLFYELVQKAADKENWKAFHFSSYDNPLLTRSDIDELTNEVPYSVRKQEIFGEFTDEITGEILKAEWWKYFDELHPGEIVWKIDSYDTAFKTGQENDFSVCTSWALTRTGLYLYDYWKGKLSFPDLKKKVAERFNKNKPDEILIEDKASGISLIQELFQDGLLPVKAIKVNKDKISRANAASTLLESGKVHIKNAPWTKSIVNLCADFPSGEEDDTVDSITQAVNYLKAKGYIHPAEMLYTKHRPEALEATLQIPSEFGILSNFQNTFGKY